MNEPSKEATELLATLGDGDESSASKLLPILYPELRALAGNYFRGQPNDHTLQPTALVHEAFLKLIGREHWESRDHFLAVAAIAMRQILIDHAERRATLKRGGGRLKLSLDDALVSAGSAVSRPGAEADLLTLDRSMRELAELDSRKATVVEMRCFGGMTHDQIGNVLGISKSTVESDWRMARAWLSRALHEESE